MKYIKTIAVVFLMLSLVFSSTMTTNAEDYDSVGNSSSDESFVILDENGNPKTIEIITDEEELEEEESSEEETEDDTDVEEDSEEAADSLDEAIEESATNDLPLKLNKIETISTLKSTILGDVSLINTASSSQSIVRFKTASEIGSSTIYYTEADTGRTGYMSTNSANDAAYIGTDGDYYICKISGVVIKVSKDYGTVVDYSSDSNVSYYYVNNGYLLHYFSYISGSTVYMAASRVGYQPSYLSSGVKYYSYDGHYFYSSFSKMITDYKNYASEQHSNAVNSSSPYYNYYQYLSLRSKTSFTASQMNARITSSSSAMYNSASTFISVQNTYGINAALMFGIAINESNYGKSTYATTRNNLFGLNAVDSNTSNASYFDSVEQCIQEFAYNWMSCGYLSGNDSRYRGPHLGDKHSGINVKYASDPYWGEKAAAQSYYISGASSDYGTYTIGIANVTELYLYKDASTSTKIYSSGVVGSGTAGYLYDYPVIILSGTSSWYKVQSDMALASDRSARSVSSTYDFSRDYVYAQASKVDVVVGSVSTSSSSSSSTLTNAQIISKLGYTNSSNYLTGISVGTSVSSLISSINKIQSSTTVTVKNTSSTTITSGTISTGMTLTLKTGSSSNTYTLVIRGDVNGDGSIKSSDYVRIKNYIMGSVSLTAAQKLAADANKDGSIKSSDYARIKNYIMGSASITQ